MLFLRHGVCVCVRVCTAGREMPRPADGTDAWVYEHVAEPVARCLCPVSDVVTPNVVTSLGILVSGFLAWNIANDGGLPDALALAGLMAGLDCLDGSIARECHRGSAFGATFDIVADAAKFVGIALGTAYAWNRRRATPCTTVALVAVVAVTCILLKEAVDELCGARTYLDSVPLVRHNSTLLAVLGCGALKLAFRGSA